MFEQLEFLISFHFGKSGSEFYIHISFEFRERDYPFWLSYISKEREVEFSEDCKDVDDLTKAVKKERKRKNQLVFVNVVD